MPNRLANYTGHQINILPNPELGTPRYDIDPSLPLPARAQEFRRRLGFVGIQGFLVPVDEVRHGSAIRLPAPAEDVLGVASLDTLRARYRDVYNIGGYAAPDDIVRDDEGEISAALSVAIPVPTLDEHTPSQLVMLEAADLADIAAPRHWQNFGAFPMNFFAPGTPDIIDPQEVEPLLVIPRTEPVTVRRKREPDVRLTEKFNIPVVQTSYGEVVNLQFPEEGNVALVQQELVRTYRKLGYAVRRMVVLGDLVRNTEGGIEGGRSVVVYDPHMLAYDPF